LEKIAWALVFAAPLGSNALLGTSALNLVVAAQTKMK
jgi:hypothetical protein